LASAAFANGSTRIEMKSRSAPAFWNFAFFVLVMVGVAREQTTS
jgi:hypothetical protein